MQIENCPTLSISKKISQDAAKRWQYEYASTENAEEVDDDFNERNEIIKKFVEQVGEEGFN